MMNDAREGGRRPLLERAAARRLRSTLAVAPVVVVMGARQAGKSTLVRVTSPLEGRPYFTLDRFEILAEAREHPDDLVRRAPELVLDEVQREPDLLLAIKRAVDEAEGRRPGRFVLTGSANLLLMKRVSETLAGRAAYLTLWPLARRERLGWGRTGIWSTLLEEDPRDWYDVVRGQGVEPEAWERMAERGGYPTPAYELRTEAERQVWFEGYVQTYLERDLQDLAAIDNLVDFRRLMRAAALRTGKLLNQAEVGRDTGIPRPTVHRYLNLLETSYQTVRLEPYSVNRTKRLIKSPKLFWADTGLALHLANEKPRGAHLENLVLGDLLAWRDAVQPRAQVLYWRTVSGEEVDLVIELGERLLAVEVKTTARPGAADARHLRTFLDEYSDRARGGILLHGGEEIFRVSERILAAPWWRVI